MIKLKPRARIIRTIGDQLISGPEAALIELVKNSYDADATEIKIKISPPNTQNPTGSITIFDNGHGMTKVDVLEKWLEPATDEKKINSVSKSGNRTVLGAKGIGRFASSRLGSNTIIESTALNNDGKYEKTLLKINWNEFEEKKYLEDINIDINSEIFEKESTGFNITIENISITWTEKIIENIINELRKIISPNEIRGTFDIYFDILDFEKNDSINFSGKEILEKEFYDEDEDELKIITLIRPYPTQNNADYHLHGKFDELGNFEGIFTIERGDNSPQSIIAHSPKMNLDEKSCGPFEINLKIYDLEGSSIKSLFERMGVKNLGISRLKDIIKKNSGISIYRNGFRIRPYGDADVDWLTLEKRRVQEPSKRIGHSQASGKIIITNETTSNLIERSSREGFEHNESFNRLKDLIINILKIIEEKRQEYREKAGISRKTKGDIGKAKNYARLDNLIEASKDLPPAYQRAFQEKIEAQSHELTKTIEEIEAYQKLLESRSALSLVVAQVIHDGRRYLEPMFEAAKLLIDHNERIFEVSSVGDVIRKYYPVHAKTIQNGLKGLSSLFKSLDPISGRKRGKPQNFKIVDVINLSIDFLGNSIIENDIKIINKISQNHFSYGYSGDLQSAVLNIIDNAIYWLSTTNSERKVIIIESFIQEGNLIIKISNNGPLIDDFFIPRLFNPGSSLKTDGHGLGLAIAKEASIASKGDVTFDQSAGDTTFVIRFPAGAISNV